MENKKIYRIIDANLNRLKEGIRVAEDIARYYFDNKDLTIKLKTIRHSAKLPDELLEKIITERNISTDVLNSKTVLNSEKKRKDLKDILISNMRRAEESSRVLEELLKLDDEVLSDNFKKIRYQLYNLEQIFFTLFKKSQA